MTWLEHLVSILSSKVHSLVDDILLDIDFLEFVRVGRVEDCRAISILKELLGLSREHIGHVLSFLQKLLDLVL